MKEKYWDFVDNKFSFDNRRHFAQKLKQWSKYFGALFGLLIIIFCVYVIELDPNLILSRVLMPLCVITLVTGILDKRICDIYLSFVKARYKFQNDALESHRYAIKSILEATNYFFYFAFGIAGHLFGIGLMLVTIFE